MRAPNCLTTFQINSFEEQKINVAEMSRHLSYVFDFFTILVAQMQAYVEEKATNSGICSHCGWLISCSDSGSVLVIKTGHQKMLTMYRRDDGSRIQATVA